VRYFHGGNLREFIEKYSLSSDEIIDFSANTNPLGVPPSVKKVIINNLNCISHYPDPECKELKKEISRYLRINYDNIIIGNGSIELIYLLVRILLPKKALLLIPAFSEYQRALINENCEIKFLKLEEKENFKPDIKLIEKTIEKVNLFFLANPNNPTGVIIPREELLPLVDKASKKHTTIILDEAFIEFKERESLVKEATSSDHLFILRSFTKFFGLAGLRIGYGIGSKERIERLNRVKEPWTVNVLAQMAAKEVIQDTEYINKTHQWINKERNFLFKHLLKIKGLKPYSSEANFILIKIEKKLSSTKLQEELAKKGIIIRDCANFRGLNHKFIRVAIRTRYENMKLIKALKETLSI